VSGNNISRSNGSASDPSPQRCAGPAAAWRHVVPCLAAALVGALLSVAAWYAFLLRENRVAELEFNARAGDYRSVLQTGIDDYIDKLDAVRALFVSIPGVSRQQFLDYANTLLQGHPAILAVSWVPRVTHGERAAHERAAAGEGFVDYRIKSQMVDGKLATAPEAAEYFPVLYSMAAGPTTAWIGTNMDDGQTRGRTLARARATGTPATSERLRLLSGSGDGSGFFVMVPVYRPGQPRETVEDRRNVLGIVQGVFQTRAMIERILRSALVPGGFDLYFFAQGEGSSATLQHFHPSRRRSAATEPQPRAEIEAGLHRTMPLTVGDAQWTLIAKPIPGGPGTASRTGSWLVLLGGLSFTALVSAFLWASGQHSRRIQAANNELDIAIRTLDNANARLQAQNIRFDAALNNMSQGLVMFDSNERIVVCNDRYIEMYDLPGEIVKPGCPLIEVLRLRHASGAVDRDPEELRAQVLAGIAQNSGAAFAFDMTDGRTVSIATCAMADGGWVATHEDITERRRAEAEIAYMARHDALTHLPNRRQFNEQLQQIVAQSKAGDDVAVLCLDIDRFKSVNDTLGHPVGDVLLSTVATRLRRCVREADVVARLGGDEFAIVQVGVAQPTEATALSARIIDAISAPYDLDGHQVVVGMSVGIAIAPTDGTDAHQLLKNADMALYRAKADGRGVYRFFEPEMDARMQARRALELDLRKALVSGEFELFYQPLVEAQTERVLGFEALIRWQHPTRGMIAPLEFIPLAEETGLIVPLGEWVLHQACNEAVTWPDDLSVAVNLSPMQFKSKQLVPTVVNVLAASGLPSSRLELEITESVLLQDSDATLATLHQLRGLGIKISMDDFGTGYSSLGYLRTFPFDKIKIDKSFIQDMPTKADSLAIIRAVVAIGASLGINTTAEGVETPEQFERLRREGCTEVQGYYFSPPCPASEVRKLIASTLPKLKAIA
jgi:diguanylate cyclase (GGDEF)-like protein